MKLCRVLCIRFSGAGHTLSNVRKVSLRSSTSSSVKSLIASASDTAMLILPAVVGGFGSDFGASWAGSPEMSIGSQDPPWFAF